MYSNILRKCTSGTLVDKTMKIIRKYRTLVNWSIISCNFHLCPAPLKPQISLTPFSNYYVFPTFKSTVLSTLVQSTNKVFSFWESPFFSLSLFLPLTDSYSSLKGLWNVIFRAVFPAVPTGISPSACLLHVPMSVFPKSLRVFIGTGALRQLSGESNSHIAELNIYQSELKGKNIIPSEKQNLYQKLFK